MNLSNLFPKIPPILPPKRELLKMSYRSRAREWSFPKELLNRTIEIDGERMKPILTIDANIPGDEFARLVNRFPAGSREANLVFSGKYDCSSDCALCFNGSRLVNHLLYTDEVLGIFDQLRPMGLRSIKFLGPGELLEKKDLWRVLDYTQKHNIVLGVFTKAGVLGSEWLAKKYHGISSKEMVERVLQYPNINFYMEGRSFDPVWENRFIPLRDKEDAKHVNYYEALCLAYERLAEAGVNSDLNCQRMTIQCNPVTHQNIDGVFDIYKWGVERNMPVYLPVTMASGKGHMGITSAISDLYLEKYFKLAVDVYTWAINRGVMTLEQFREEGAHPYLGTAPCNQLSHGLYIHADGQVWRCPGNDTKEFVVHPNVREQPLKEIWEKSRNYTVNAFNNHCVKDGVCLPTRFYTEVPRKVKERLAK